ncbi:unnamed protein product [Orchesella dallaii]|uniref:Uncharacterized protein n=1 Tax=Orchesella dallaii TaxID=48710 RepID=A0ABP1PUY4_9HEXA
METEGEEKPCILMETEEGSEEGIEEAREHIDIPSIILTGPDGIVLGEDAVNIGSVRARSSTIIRESVALVAHHNGDIENPPVELHPQPVVIHRWWDEIKKTLLVFLIFVILFSACYIIFYM